jgi:hypothetical protein
LLDESTDVWRPARARRLASGAYELAPSPVPADESWEFAPGDHVEVQTRVLSGGAAHVAVARTEKRGRTKP